MKRLYLGGILILALILVTNVANYSVSPEESKTESFMQLDSKISPKDRISEGNIHVYADRVVIEISNPEWARFTDTKSMEPVLHSGSNAIQIVPTKPEQLQKGDIISFETKQGIIIHRITELGEDSEGWYAITKGDNAPISDGKVRWSQVKRVVVAVVY